MSKLRQHDGPTDEPAVRGYSVTHPPGRATLRIGPGWHQLLFAASGTMTITTGNGSWTVPPRRALWVSGDTPATIANRFPVAVRSLYFAHQLRPLGGEVRSVEITALLREVILHVVRICPLDLTGATDRALVTVLVDELRRAPDADLHLPMPPHPGPALDAAHRITRTPTMSLEDVARAVGVSRRTLERAFPRATGLTAGAWRRRARILASLDFLGADVSVTRTAAEIGYSTPSAFVTAFKAELGHSPGRYLRDRSAPPRTI